MGEARDQNAREHAKREVLASVQADRASNDKTKEQECEAIAAAEREQKDRQAAEKEQLEKEKKSKMREDTQAFLRQQIQQKQLVKRTEDEQRLMLRMSQEADASSFEASERQRRAEKRQQLIEHSSELQRQVAARMPMTSGKDCMSECELRLNKKLLEHVTHALSEISAAPSVVA